MKLKVAKIAEFISANPGESTGSRVSFCEQDVAYGYSTDSRTITKGDLFFAVKGERLDGHDYVAAALEKGAVAAVVAKDHLHRYVDRSRLLLVEDTLVALQTLATAVRRVWGKPLIGITGSAGKTTTKEAIAHVLATRFRMLESEASSK